LDRVPADEYTGEIKLAAIEGADGSPRGIAQTTNDGKRIIALANRMGLALVSGSDNHGWAQAAPSWSVLRIPGWRALTPAALDIAIRRTIIARVPGSTQVIARRMANPVTGRIGKTLGGVAVAALMFRTMNWRDRVSWLGWGWGLALFPSFSARRRRRSIRVWRRARRLALARRPLVDAAAAMEVAS
jgi:hypothetical protein